MHSTNATQPISQYYRNGYGDIPPRLHVLMVYSISSINIPFDWIYAEAFEQLVPTTPSSCCFVVVFATRLIDLIELIEPWNGVYDYSSNILDQLDYVVWKKYYISLDKFWFHSKHSKRSATSIRAHPSFSCPVSLNFLLFHFMPVRVSNRNHTNEW